MKRSIHEGGEERREAPRRRPSTLPPLSEAPAGSLASQPDARIFEYAYEMLRVNGMRIQQLSDLHPELNAEIRKRNLLELLTHSLNVVTMDPLEVEKEILEVFKRQSLTSFFCSATWI